MWCRAKPELNAQGDSLGRTMVTGSCTQLRRMHINSYMVQVCESTLQRNEVCMIPVLLTLCQRQKNILALRPCTGGAV